MNKNVSPYLQNLVPWEYKVKEGYVLRGYHSQPSGKPLIHFIHGNGFCGLTFELLLSYFQDDFDLFISDAQGHGNSDAGGAYEGWNKSSKRFAQVFKSFQHHWQDVPRIAMGHSYGAVMSTLMIAREPDLFNLGMLMDPVYSPPRLAATMNVMSTLGLMKRMPMARQARIRTGQWQSFDAAWDYLYQRGTFKGWDDRCLKSYIDQALQAQDDNSLTLKCPPRIEAAIFSDYAQGLWSSIKKIRIPMTMMYGEKTYPFVRQCRSRVHHSNMRYDFIKMPGGHCFMQQYPEYSAEEISLKLAMELKRIG